MGGPLAALFISRWRPCRPQRRGVDSPGASQKGGASTIDVSEATRRWRPERAPASTQLSRFIGRERELDELEDLQAGSRLVTLTGPGGSGKTRLGLELATRLAPRFRDGYALVDLAPITDPELVPAAILAALHVRPDPEQPVLDTLLQSLLDRHLLLVLDNFEQLPRTSIVADLLACCPGISILATSRTPLHLRGEQQFPVDPMVLPGGSDLTTLERLVHNDAVALFVDRACSINPHFALTAANCAAVAAICIRLDGLPLAIELAAARSGLLAPAALLRRLEHDFSLLTSVAPDAPARQRTLNQTIAWSHDLLGDADRRVFVQLSVFVGGFDIPAVQNVVSDPSLSNPRTDTVGALDRLVDQNLVRVAPDAEGEPRFRLLETVREFALERLSADDAEALQRRHAAYFADLAEGARRQAGGPEHALWVGRIARNIDNVRAALDGARARGDDVLLARLAAAVSGFLIEGGDQLEAGRWLHAAEDVMSSAAPDVRATLLYALGEYEISYEGDRGPVEQHFSEALQLYEAANDYPAIARTLLYLANVAADLADRPTALGRLERARVAAEQVRDPLDAARIAGDIVVRVSTAKGYIDPSVARNAIRIGTAAGHRPTVAIGWMALGLRDLAAGDSRAAVDELARALEIWTELGDKPSEALVLAYIGVAKLRAGDLEASRAHLVRASQGARESPRYVGMWALDASADWLGATGRAECAVTCWAASAAARFATPDRTFVTAPEFFTRSRERDRSALRPAVYQAADATGRGMTLRQALAFTIDALNDPLPGSAHGAGDSPRRGRYDLTPREREVLGLVVAGRSDGEIGERLYISKKTAAVHVGNIKGKLGATSRVDIAGIAMRHGLVELPRDA